MLSAVASAQGAGGQEPILIFDNESGKQLDFDLRAGIEQNLARISPPAPRRGPGRPSLGVACKEVCLLPRHWEWLERQPAKASGTLRRLVEAARKDRSREGRRQGTVEAVDRFMGALGGNLAGYEEASRALYAGKWAAFDRSIASWPEDVRRHLLLLLEPIRVDPMRDPNGDTRAPGGIGASGEGAVARYVLLPKGRGERSADPGSRTPWQLSAVSLAAAISRGEISAREAMESCLERIRVVNREVNGITELFADEALSAAAEVDRRKAAGEDLGCVAGVPFTVKGNIDVAGHPTTHGIPAMREAVAPRDAPVVERFRGAGAIPVGHTNLPDLSLRFHTKSQLFGATLNPWDRSLSPAGSSGGEAAALATGMSALGLGNDAGGSVRIPAQFCAVTALKPSYGRFPSDRSVGPRDVSWASQLIPVEGVMARSVADLHLAFQVLAGPDARDPRVVPAPLFGPGLESPLRVAVVTDPGGLGIHPGAREAVERAAEVLEKEGYLLEEAELPGIVEIAEAYGGMIMTEFQQSRSMLERLLGPEGRRYLELAMSVHRPVDLAGYLALSSLRQRVQRDWAEFLERFPLVLGPVFTDEIVPADFDISGAEEYGRVVKGMRLCAATSFVGLPAVALPTGIVNGRPQGVQLIGRAYREDLCLAAAAVLEAALGRFTPIEPFPADP